MDNKTIIQVEHPEIAPEALFKSLLMPKDTEPSDKAKISEMLKEALSLAVPKSIYALVQLDEKGPDFVRMGETVFHSSFVRQRLDKVGRIAPFVSTCGIEAEEWSKQFTDPLEQFWADGIKLQLLGLASAQLRQEVRGKYFPTGDMSAMSPGSLAAWPLTEQRPLFKLLGGVTPDIGAYLTDSCLILPAKSNSGFFFAAETHHENCAYCPILTCPNRRAEFVGEIQ